MSEAEDGRLYGLMEIAEGQQAAVQAALEGLAAERVALAREREALARQVQAVEGGARAAVRAAVAEGLAGAATEGVAAVQAATGPLLSRLAGVVEQAGQAETALRGVVAWASWPAAGLDCGRRGGDGGAGVAHEQRGAVVEHVGHRGGAGAQGRAAGRGGGAAGQPGCLGQGGCAGEGDPVQPRQPALHPGERERRGLREPGARRLPGDPGVLRAA